LLSATASTALAV